MKARTFGWLAMALVLVGTLLVGVTADREPRTPEERAQSVAETISCPVCAGQSVADSEALPARAIRGFINEQVAAGATDEEIREKVDARYPESLLLTPTGSGVGGVVWVLPVVALVLGLAVVGYAFHRWRRSAGGGAVSAADRDLIDRVLEGRRSGPEEQRAP